MRPILTVGIPTYNRVNGLEKILKQLDKERGGFNILISDNNSSDGTQAMVERYKRNMPNLRYNKNEINLGYSGNLLKLYMLAKTRYIWFLADDEDVLPGAIDKIIKSLNKYKPVVALFNHLTVDPYGKKNEDGVKNDTIYADINEFKDYTSIARTGFISIIVVERNLSFKDIEKAYIKDNFFFQLSLSLRLLSNRFKLCEIASPIVFRNQSYKHGEFFKLLMVDMLTAMSSNEHKFNKKRFINLYRRKVLKALELYLSQKLGLFKFYGNPSWKTIREIIEYYGFLSIFILLFPIFYFFVPTFLIKFIYRTQLIRMHGESEGSAIYKRNLNRVLKYKRSSGFVDC